MFGNVEEVSTGNTLCGACEMGALGALGADTAPISMNLWTGDEPIYKSPWFVFGTSLLFVTLVLVLRKRKRSAV